MVALVERVGWGQEEEGTHIGGGDRPLRTLEAEIGFSLTTGELGRACRPGSIRGPGRKGLALVGHRDWKGRG